MAGSGNEEKRYRAKTLDAVPMSGLDVSTHEFLLPAAPPGVIRSSGSAGIGLDPPLAPGAHLLEDEVPEGL